MDPATPIVMILLACTADSSRCHEMQSREAFPTREQCQAAIPEMLAQHNASVGRCGILEPGHAAGEPAVEAGAPDGLVTVRVTRKINGRDVTDLYWVPRS